MALGYSTGWTAIASNPHEESLAARVYVRGVTYDNVYNLWDWNTDNVSYPDTVGTTGPPTASTISSPVSPTGEPTRKLEGYEYFVTQYEVPDGALDNAETIVASVYVHTGSSAPSPATEPPCQLRILNTTKSSSLAYVYFLSSGGTITATGGYPSDGYSGITDLGDGWYRVWCGAAFSTAKTPYDEYRVYVEGADGLAGTPVRQIIYSSPQITPNQTGLTTFAAGEGTAVYPSETLVELASCYETLNISALTRKRERYYGVVQGQSSLFTITDANLTKAQYARPAAWCAIQAGFPTYNQWETVLQGRIKSSELNTDLMLAVTVGESIMDLLQRKTNKEYFFTGTGSWAGEISKVVVDEDSDVYNNDSGSVLTTASYSATMRDQLYKIVFDSATQYRVYNEQDLPVCDITGDYVDTGTTYNISTDAEFGERQYQNTSANMFTIESAGWNSGTFASGDTFQFSTSRARTTDELTPIGMVKHLIEDVADIRAFDVMNGEYYSSPLYDYDNWTGKVDESYGAIGGYWKAGSKLIEMVQDALKLEHATIYPTEPGQIALWVVDGARSGATILNGMAGTSTDIISASMVEDDSEFANVITIKYLDLVTGEDRAVTAEPRFKDRPNKELTIESKWRVQDAVAETCISQALTRFNYDRKTYTTNTTRVHANIDITDPVVINEPFLNLGGTAAEITERQLDIINNTVTLISWNDALATLNKARIDSARIDATGTTIW